MALGVTAVATATQAAVLFAAAKYARGQADEARKLREGQARPFVVVDFHVEQTIIYLTVKNTGALIARNVRFSFSPPLEATMDDPERKTAELKMFRESIPTLAPGKFFSTAFDSFPAREQSGLPDAYAVIVRYRGELPHDYEDEQILDLGIYRNLLHVNRRTIHDVAERLKEMKDELHKWTATGGGLLTLSPEELRTRWQKNSAGD
jgi:hypothetical protein